MYPSIFIRVKHASTKSHALINWERYVSISPVETTKNDENSSDSNFAFIFKWFLAEMITENNLNLATCH